MENLNYQGINTAEVPQVISDLNIKKIIPGTLGLVGELGAGKTTLVKFLAESLGIKSDEVCSPSYNLLNEYQSAQYAIEHWDLYRLDSLPEELNFKPEENVLRIIEWSNLVERPEEIIDYQIKIEIKDDTRDYSFTKFNS